MLSSKGMRARIIQGIVRLFDNLDEKCRQDDLQERYQLFLKQIIFVNTRS